VVRAVPKEHSVWDCLTIQDEGTVFFETWGNCHLTQNLAPRRPDSQALKLSLIFWKNVNKLGDIFSLIKVKGQDQNVTIHYTMSYQMKAPVMIFLGARMSSIEIRI